jgi:hypothetical protein
MFLGVSVKEAPNARPGCYDFEITHTAPVGRFYTTNNKGKRAMKKEQIELSEEQRQALQTARNSTFRVALDLMDKGLEDMGADTMRLALKFGKATKAKKAPEVDARQVAIFEGAVSVDVEREIRDARRRHVEALGQEMSPAEFQEDGIGEGPDMAPGLEALPIVTGAKKRGARE